MVTVGDGVHAHVQGVDPATIYGWRSERWTTRKIRAALWVIWSSASTPATGYGGDRRRPTATDGTRGRGGGPRGLGGRAPHPEHDGTLGDDGGARAATKSSSNGGGPNRSRGSIRANGGFPARTPRGGSRGRRGEAPGAVQLSWGRRRRRRCGGGVRLGHGHGSGG